MKKLLFLLLMAPMLLFAQDKNDYTRSSLHLHLVDDFDFESGDYVLKSYQKFHKDHFPENYNNHSIDLNKIRLENWQLSEEEMAAAGKSNNALGNAMSQSASGATGGALKIQDNSMVKLQLDKYIAEKKIAHELIKKWWSVKDDGSYSNAYIISRTLENESV